MSNKHNKKNETQNIEYKIALKKLSLYKKKYHSFNNKTINYEDNISIDFCAEKVARYRHYKSFFPELLEKQK